jgi:post-segregation antitoxin (ccd killing protein)
MDDGARETTVQINVSKAAVDGAEALGLDVARIAEVAILRQTRVARHAAMTDEERAKIQAEIQAEIAWYNEHVDKHGHFSDHWRQF